MLYPLSYGGKKPCLSLPESGAPGQRLAPDPRNPIPTSRSRTTKIRESNHDW